MAMVEWRLRADEFANCNCAYGCPCQFNALPTHGYCEAAAGWKIQEGHFGDVRLHGLSATFSVHWPGAIHEGNGTMQVVVDERADARQRDALLKILYGEKQRRWRQGGGCFPPCVRTSSNHCFCRSIWKSMLMPGGGGLRSPV